MKKQNTYMVAIQVMVQVPVIIYEEVFAANGKEAARKVEKNFRIDQNTADSVMGEIQESIENDGKPDVKTLRNRIKGKRFTSAGLASQYHSTAECQMCQAVERAEKKQKLK